MITGQALHVKRNIEERSRNYFAVENNKCYTLWVCVYRLRYPAWKAGAPYCHMCPVRFSNVFPCYLIKGTIFGYKKVFQHKMCVLIFSTMFVGNISHY
jgi:hypothetical protein